MGTLDGLVEQYVRERVRRNEVEPCTAANIRYHLSDFAASFGKRPIDHLGVRSVERWISQMEDRGIARSTQASRLSSLRGFGAWLARRGIAANFTADAPKVRRPRVRPRDMTNEHVHACLQVARNERDRLLIWLMFGCGLRRVEVHRLDVEDWECGRLHVTGKGGHQRYVPTLTVVEAAIEDYLRAAGHHAGPMLRTGAGGRLSRRQISQIVTRMTVAAGIKIGPWDGRSAHGFRAAGASDLADHAEDIREVQEFLGHVDLSNLKHYLRRAEFERLVQAQRRREQAA